MRRIGLLNLTKESVMNKVDILQQIEALEAANTRCWARQMAMPTTRSTASYKDDLDDRIEEREKKIRLLKNKLKGMFK